MEHEFPFRTFRPEKQGRFPFNQSSKRPVEFSATSSTEWNSIFQNSQKEGPFPFHQNFRKIGNSGKRCRHLPEKLPEIPRAIEFPKCEPFKTPKPKTTWFHSDFPRLVGSIPTSFPGFSLTWDQALLFFLFFASLFLWLERHKGIIGRGHDLRLGSLLPYSLAPQGRVEENPGIKVGSIQN